MTDERRTLDVEQIEETDGIRSEGGHAVGIDSVRLGRAAIAPLVIGNCSKSRGGECGHLVAPRVGELGEAVDQDDRLTGPLVDGRELHALEYARIVWSMPRG